MRMCHRPLQFPEAPTFEEAALSYGNHECELCQLLTTSGVCQSKIADIIAGIM